MTEKTLIGLVDGSSYSESLCHYLAFAATRLGANVKLYHVLGRRDTAAGQDLSGTIRLGARSRLMEQLSALDEERSRIAAEQGRAILEDAQSIITRDADIAVETRLRHGDLVATVTAKEERGEMLFIGKRGEAADFASGHLGSNLERVVRASHRPVFVVNRAFAEPDRVVLAFDDGDSSKRAISFASESPLTEGLPILLAHAGEETPAIHAAKAELEKAGRTVQIHCEWTEAETLLSRLTSEHPQSLLIMGAYSHSRIRQLFIGSTTTEMLLSCKVPVILMR